MAVIIENIGMGASAADMRGIPLVVIEFTHVNAIMMWCPVTTKLIVDCIPYSMQRYCWKVKETSRTPAVYCAMMHRKTCATAYSAQKLLHLLRQRRHVWWPRLCAIQTTKMALCPASVDVKSQIRRSLITGHSANEQSVSHASVSQSVSQWQVSLQSYWVPPAHQRRDAASIRASTMLMPGVHE